MRPDVTPLYEQFPFPSPDPGAALIDVVARELPFVLADSSLAGQRVLDAGCGTGHTLVGLAAQHPQGFFVGVDGCRRSLAIARELARRHGVDNVEFVHGRIPDVRLPTAFDLVICFGVLHHLPEPRAGLVWLADQLTPDGLLHLWLYHAVGEHRRMLDRELVGLLAAGRDPDGGLEVVRRLGLSLSLAEYGFPAGWTGTRLTPVEQDVFDADAYLNPVVRPMRFGDLPALSRGTALDWLAADRLYGPGGVPFVDLAGHEPDSDLFVRPEHVCADPVLRERLRAMDNGDRLRVLELRTRPTGFRVVAGRGASLGRCVPRIAGNLLAGAPRPAAAEVG